LDLYYLGYMENPTRLNILHGDRDDGPGGPRTAKLQDRKLKTIAFHRDAGPGGPRKEQLEDRN